MIGGEGTAAFFAMAPKYRRAKAKREHSEEEYDLEQDLKTYILVLA